MTAADRVAWYYLASLESWLPLPSCSIPWSPVVGEAEWGLKLALFCLLCSLWLLPLSVQLLACPEVTMYQSDRLRQAILELISRPHTRCGTGLLKWLTLILWHCPFCLHFSSHTHHESSFAPVCCNTALISYIN